MMRLLLKCISGRDRLLARLADGVIRFEMFIEGFGQTGPYRKRGGFDSIAIAIGGLMHITGPEVGVSIYCGCLLH